MLHASYSLPLPDDGPECPGWIVDDPTAHPEQNLERYELATCPVCTRIHLVNPKTCVVLGAPVVRTVGRGEAVRDFASGKSKTAIENLASYVRRAPKASERQIASVSPIAVIPRRAPI